MRVDLETRFSVGDNVHIAIWSNTVREFDIKPQVVKSIRIEYTDKDAPKVYYNGYLDNLTFDSWSATQTAIKTCRI